MSELKNTLFGTSENSTEEPDIGFGTEIDGQVTLNDAYEPIIPDYPDEEVQTVTPDELIRDSMSAVERMKLEIAEENENLDKRFAEMRSRPAAKTQKKIRQTYIIGVLSGSVSLVFMGIALLISTATSPIGAYAALKLSPIMLVFLGAEILYAVFRKRSLRIRIDLRSVIVIASLMVISAILATVSVAASAGTGERLYAEQRIQNMLASDLHDAIAKDYIKSVDIETQLYGEDAEMYVTPADLTDGDIINLTVNFSDAQMTIREFAKDCKDVINDIHTLPYNFGTVNFVADDLVNHYVLNVDWHYQSDFDADKLAGLVNYFGNGISDADIPDVTDDDQ